MKIVFLDFDSVKNPLLGAGQAYATLEVGFRLVKMGHKVVSLTSKYPGYKDGYYKGIYYKHIGAATKFIKLNNLIYIFSLPFELFKLEKDIVIECFTAPISTLFSPLYTNKPVVALPSMFNASEFTQKYKLPFHLIEKFGLRFYKYIMPYSDTDSAKAKKLNPKIKIKIIPQGVSEEYFKLKPKKSKHILFLSRFDIAQKGIDLLLKAYAKAAEKIAYPLVIAGHGPDEGKIRNMISKLGLEKKVEIAGSAYGKKKFKLMAEALFVAFPSRHDEMCLWSLEAFASGLPCVCFDIPESKWMGGNVSIKSKPFNVDDYSKKLVLATDIKLISKMRINARKFAKGFSWERVALEFDSFFKEVLVFESGRVREGFSFTQFLRRLIKLKLLAN